MKLFEIALYDLFVWIVYLMKKRYQAPFKVQSCLSQPFLGFQRFSCTPEGSVDYITFFFPHRQTWLKSKPQLCRNAQQNPNQWRLCKEFHYWTLGWPHASAMSGVILGVLPLRWRNPHWFLIRTCQVSIKEVPSPPLVSIEIRLTNKNSLAALFAQSGLLLLLCV